MEVRLGNEGDEVAEPNSYGSTLGEDEPLVFDEELRDIVSASAREAGAGTYEGITLNDATSTYMMARNTDEPSLARFASGRPRWPTRLTASMNT